MASLLDADALTKVPQKQIPVHLGFFNCGFFARHIHSSYLQYIFINIIVFIYY